MQGTALLQTADPRPPTEAITPLKLLPCRLPRAAAPCTSLSPEPLTLVSPIVERETAVEKVQPLNFLPFCFRLPFLKQNLKRFELAERSGMRRAAAWSLCVALLKPEPGSGWLASAPSAAAGLQVKERLRDAGGLAFRTFFIQFSYVKF